MKNTKIMAILALFLATALFIGAASAAYTLTVDPTTAEVGTATTFTVNLTNTTAPGVDTVFKINISNVNCGLITLNSTVSNETTFSYTPSAVSTFTILANDSAGTTVASVAVTVTSDPSSAASKIYPATEEPTDYTGGYGPGTYQAMLTSAIPLASTMFYHTTEAGETIQTDGDGVFVIDENTMEGIYSTSQSRATDYYLAVYGTSTPIPTKPMSVAVNGSPSIASGESIALDVTLNEPLVTGATFTVNYGDGSASVDYTSSLINNQKVTLPGHKYSKVGTFTITYTYTGTTAVSNKGVGTVTVSETVMEVDVGETAFVYQTIKLNSTNFTSGKLNFYSSDASPVVINTMTIASDGSQILEAAVNGNYGTWYADGSKPTDKSPKFINIWYPEMTLKGELTTGADGATSGDSIDGKTINKNTEVSFLIEAPKVGQVPNLATVKIVFTTPVAGKTTQFGYLPDGTTPGEFTGIAIDSAKVIALKTGVEAGDNAAAGTYTAQAEFTSPVAFKNYAKKSNTVSFTLQSSTLTITASKDSVVRSNPFTVTISGDSKMPYAVYIESPSTNEINPTIQDGQVGFQSGYYATPATGYTIDAGYISYDSITKIGAIFETDASGKRNIQFNTAANTEDKTYTIKVSGLTNDQYGDLVFNSADYDKVKVKVEKGAVTIAATGDGAYFIGDEIKLTGTNTDSTLVFLFITGQNLAENGIQVKALPDKFSAKDNSQPVAVKTDNTWEYKWDTSKIALDTGAYTIYATSRLTNGKSSEAGLIENADAYQYGADIDGKTGKYAVKLSDSEYATVSINLKQPFLSAVPSGTIVAKGDKIYIRGTAEGDPSSLNIFIFGPNFFEPYSVSVEDDGSYEKKIEIPSTMSSNQYFVVVQHPMYNDQFDARLVALDKNGNGITGSWPNDAVAQWAFKTVNTTTGGDAQSFIVWGSANKLQGSQAADALTKMIDSANIDDIYTKLTFTVAEPWIRIVNPGDKAAGSSFTISGTTNLAVDDQILVEVMSSSFSAIDKTSTSTTSGVSQSTKVVAGEGADNTWSVDVDTTNWKLDEYTIKVNGIEVDVTTTTNFNLVEKVVTTVPATSATTAVPTGATSVPTTTPTKTPGFGAFIALAGLGAVALLVLRRN